MTGIALRETLVMAIACVILAAPAARADPAGITGSEAIGTMPILSPGGPRAATDLHAEARCGDVDLRKGYAVLGWSVATKPGSEQRVAVTIYRDGFETGNYRVSEALAPERASFVWDEVSGQAIHRWRVLTLRAEGWVPSETAQFVGPGCVADFVPHQGSQGMQRDDP